MFSRPSCLPDGRVLRRASPARVVKAFRSNRRSLDTIVRCDCPGLRPCRTLSGGQRGLGRPAYPARRAGHRAGECGSDAQKLPWLPGGNTRAELIRRGWQQALWFGVHMQVGRRAVDIGLRREKTSSSLKRAPRRNERSSSLQASHISRLDSRGWKRLWAMACTTGLAPPSHRH